MCEATSHALLLKVQHDLRTALLCCNNNLVDIACYYIQQATEKILKYQLYCLGVQAPVRTQYS